MNEEQQFKQQALSAGMAALNAEFRTQIERRDIEGYQEAVLQLLLNVDETWRAKNEKSFFEKALDQIDNGFGAVGEKLGHDNISGHEMVKPDNFDMYPEILKDMIKTQGSPDGWKRYQVEGLKPRDWSNATLDDVPVDWKPEVGQECFSVVDGKIYTMADLNGWVGPGRRFPTMKLAVAYRDSQKPVERWRPEMGEICWVLGSDGEQLWFIWKATPEQNGMLEFGTIFRTEQEALAARERVKAALQGK